MAKNVDVDQLEAKIRDLKSIIRSLQRKLKKASRGYKKHLIVDDEGDKDKDPENLCPHCSKGSIKTTNILDRIFVSCNICDYREKIK